MEDLKAIKALWRSDLHLMLDLENQSLLLRWQLPRDTHESVSCYSAWFTPTPS